MISLTYNGYEFKDESHKLFKARTFISIIFKYNNFLN
jgi:hypothetical protein